MNHSEKSSTKLKLKNNDRTNSGVTNSIARPQTSTPPSPHLPSVVSLLQLVTKLFPVVDETYIGTNSTVHVSFITDCKSYTTDCKSDTANCKFCQHLQLAIVARTVICLTITRGGRAIEIKPSTPGGGGGN